MSRITLIVGLPGSGKTFLANLLSTFSTVVVDDITSTDQLPDTCDDLIITDVNFCDGNILNKALAIFAEKYDAVPINIIYFECNAEAARRNVEYRNDGRNVEGTIRRFENIYDPPDNARKIWAPSI